MTPSSSNSSSRRMRRTRELSTSSSRFDLLSGYDWYQIQGDSKAALDSLLQQQQQQPTETNTTTTTNASGSKGNKNKNSESSTTSVADYNILLLEQLAGRNNSSKNDNEDDKSFLQMLQDCESKLTRGSGNDPKGPKTSSSLSSSSFARKRARNQLIMTYNRALILHGAGETSQCVALLQEHLAPLLQQQQKDQQGVPEEMTPVAFHMGLLLLEALLGLDVGRNTRTTTSTAKNNNNNNLSMTDVIEWLEVLDDQQQQQANHHNSQGGGGSGGTGGDPQLKFLLSLYKSRVDLSQRDAAGKHVDGRIRSARKELKSAMEVFQQKLRPSFGAETASVVSSANDSATEGGEREGTTSSEHGGYHQQQPPSSIVLQKYNQSALSLKANLEQLKGNTKKSLILCSEAQSAVVKTESTTATAAAASTTTASSTTSAAATTNNDGDDHTNDPQQQQQASYSLYDMVHSNNLAVVYETNDKRHLALHALTKGLRAAAVATDHSNNNTSASALSLFHPDGTVRPNLTTAVLHNAAICALQAKKYLTAYECMAACVVLGNNGSAGSGSGSSSSDDRHKNAVFRNRPRCWLRMAQACIGRFTELRRQKSTKFATVEINGEPHGIVVDSSMLTDDVTVIREKLVEQVGSPEDLEQVKRSPLLRARAALERVIQHHQSNEEDDADDDDGLDAETLTGARLSLAYVSLAFGDYQQALHISKLVLLELEETSSNNDNQVEEAAGTNADAPTSPPTTTNPVARRLQARQMATARMYAAEASCALGEMVESMKYLVGDGKDDAFDRLASDLGGVTLETAAGNGKGKRRLAKAQTMVRSSACAVTAAMGNTVAAKQLANSANAMEDAYASNRERSSARRALIYALLRDGHQSPALNLLLSLR